MQRLRFAVAALWTASLLTVGLAAMTLSAVLADRVVFGNTVSMLFRIEAMVGVVCGLAMLVLAYRDKALEQTKRRAIMVLSGSMLLCVLGYFEVQPMLAEIRAAAGAGGVAGSPHARMFGILHAVSLLFYVVQAVLGVVLVRKTMKPAQGG